MIDVDTWRKSEAEARQDMQTRTCTNCGDFVDDCDSFQCPECHEYYCPECITGMPGHRICAGCMEKEEAFDESIDCDHPLFDADIDGKYALFKKYKAASDKRTMATLARIDEERGK